MKIFVAAFLIFASIALPVLASAEPEEDATPLALTTKIGGLDGKVFGAYNDCDMPLFGSFFSPTVEFYHDKGGATFDRETVITNTKKYICGKVRRDLISSSLHVYPIKGFGAIEEGEHRFCELASGNCDGVAKFLIVWKQTGDTWQITRVLSFGHRALTETEKAGTKR